MRWDDVPVFLAVARTGTLAAAAEVLEVNPSTVHRRVSAIEHELGVELFARDQRGYALTPVGEALVPQAEELEDGMLALRRAASGHDRSARGPVTLTLPSTMVTLVAPRLVEVCKQCPGLQPILRSDDRVLDLGADADVALRPSATPPPSAVGRRLGRVAWAVYGPAGESRELPWLAYTQGAGPAAAAAWQRRAHPDAPVMLEVSSVGGLHRALVSTQTCGLLPCYLGDPDERLERRSDVIPEASVDLWLLVHADLRKSARVRALVDLLVPRLEEARPLIEGRSI